MADLDKGYRLLDLYIRFKGGSRLSVKQMTSDYGIKRRTVQRDLEMLQYAGRLELEYEEQPDGTRKWFLKESDRKVDVTYTIRDVMALFLGRRMFDFLEHTLLEESINRVYQSIEEKLRRPDDRLRAQMLFKKIHLVHEGPKKLKVKSREILDTCPRHVTLRLFLPLSACGRGGRGVRLLRQGRPRIVVGVALEPPGLEPPGPRLLPSPPVRRDSRIVPARISW